MEAFAPIPTAIVRRAMIEKPGLFRSVLNPNFKSWSSALKRQDRGAAATTVQVLALVEPNWDRRPAAYGIR
jgi:hypothetical protein